MTDCIRGCLLVGEHIPDCTCTLECADHHGHCEGCLPKPAVVGAYCQRCIYRFRDALEEIPQLAYRVATEGLARAQQDGTAKATTVHPPTPSPHWDTVDEVTMWSGAWAYALSREIRTHDPIPVNVAGIPSPDVFDACEHLLTFVDQALTFGGADELYGEALAWRGKLTQMLGGKPKGDADGRLVNITEAAVVVDRTTRTIRAWIANGKLTAVAHMKDTHLYLERDVRAAAGQQRCAMSDLWTGECEHCRTVSVA